ncbi:MAG: TIM barrel protein [Rectinemataceae bacterium]|jgi:sugar phosphate isomerase/epimerase
MDNCFAIKRWIKPSQWMPLIKDLGLNSIEASTDNEMDPMFAPQSYLDDWVKDVQNGEKALGMKVRSFFTGYQTYRTAGLAHPDARVRSKIKEEWFKPLIRHAEKLDADIGFSFHAIQEEDLRDPTRYETACRVVIDEYAELAAYAREHGGVNLCCEQMYAPYQTPWTIDGAIDFLKKVYAIGKDPFYIAVDVGHMVGQRKYVMPTKASIVEALNSWRADVRPAALWLGPSKAFEMFHNQEAEAAETDELFADHLMSFIGQYPYMFSSPEDGDPFKWLDALGPYSPIIHMQQTDGISSGHAPFTAETNKKGIITGERLLHALADGYARAEMPGMPPRAEKIVLAFEIFISNVQFPYDALNNLKETINYWKKFIPKDGITLRDALR